MPSQAAPDRKELIEMVAQRKGDYQAPKFVEFIDSIPETSTQKVDKKALRARYAQLAGSVAGSAAPCDAHEDGSAAATPSSCGG
jgi:acyl-CoA synthetase (AMP-forming)/AMP-acid ligase II